MTNDKSQTLDVIESAMARVARLDGSSAVATGAERLPERLNEDVPLRPGAGRECAKGRGGVASARRFPLRSIGAHLLSAAVGATATWFVLFDSNELAAASAVPEVAIPISPPVPAPVTVAEAAVPVAVAITQEKQPEAVAESPQVLDMLEHWRLAWSSRAVDAYLGFYSGDFVPADGTSRSAWAEGRRKNLLSKSKIDVQIDNVNIASADEHHAKVQLLQSYESGRYKETGRPKTLLLTREGDDWRIVGEWQGLR